MDRREEDLKLAQAPRVRNRDRPESHIPASTASVETAESNDGNEEMTTEADCGDGAEFPSTIEDVAKESPVVSKVDNNLGEDTAFVNKAPHTYSDMHPSIMPTLKDPLTEEFCLPSTHSNAAISESGSHSDPVSSSSIRIQMHLAGATPSISSFEMLVDSELCPSLSTVEPLAEHPASSANVSVTASREDSSDLQSTDTSTTSSPASSSASSLVASPLHSSVKAADAPPLESETRSQQTITTTTATTTSNNDNSVSFTGCGLSPTLCPHNGDPCHALLASRRKTWLAVLKQAGISLNSSALNGRLAFHSGNPLFSPDGTFGVLASTYQDEFMKQIEQERAQILQAQALLIVTEVRKLLGIAVLLETTSDENPCDTADVVVADSNFPQLHSEDLESPYDTVSELRDTTGKMIPPGEFDVFVNEAFEVQLPQDLRSKEPLWYYRAAHYLACKDRDYVEMFREQKKVLMSIQEKKVDMTIPTSLNIDAYAEFCKADGKGSYKKARKGTKASHLEDPDAITPEISSEAVSLLDESTEKSSVDNVPDCRSSVSVSTPLLEPHDDFHLDVSTTSSRMDSFLLSVANQSDITKEQLKIGPSPDLKASAPSTNYQDVLSLNENVTPSIQEAVVPNIEINPSYEGTNTLPDASNATLSTQQPSESSSTINVIAASAIITSFPSSITASIPKLTKAREVVPTVSAPGGPSVAPPTTEPTTELAMETSNEPTDEAPDEFIDEPNAGMAVPSLSPSSSPSLEVYTFCPTDVLAASDVSLLERVFGAWQLRQPEPQAGTLAVQRSNATRDYLQDLHFTMHGATGKSKKPSGSNWGAGWHYESADIVKARNDAKRNLATEADVHWSLTQPLRARTRHGKAAALRLQDAASDGGDASESGVAAAASGGRAGSSTIQNHPTWASKRSRRTANNKPVGKKPESTRSRTSILSNSSTYLGYGDEYSFYATSQTRASSKPRRSWRSTMSDEEASDRLQKRRKSNVTNDKRHQRRKSVMIETTIDPPQAFRVPPGKSKRVNGSAITNDGLGEHAVVFDAKPSVVTPTAHSEAVFGNEKRRHTSDAVGGPLSEASGVHVNSGSDISNSSFDGKQNISDTGSPTTRISRRSPEAERSSAESIDAEARRSGSKWNGWYALTPEDEKLEACLEEERLK